MRLVKAFFLLLVFLLQFHLSMQHGFNHDAHQFVASGALFTRNGLLPYVDYPYFHAPYLVFIYATLFSFSPYLLWSARLFSVLCGQLVLFFTFRVAWDLFPFYFAQKRFWMAAGSTLLLLANPLFAYTSGRAWNHDLPVLLMLLALLSYRRAVSRRHQMHLWLSMSGLLVGLATGTRLSFALLTVPFVLMLMSMPPLTTRQEKVRALFFFGGALFLGLLPALLLVSWAPEQAFFGNIEYAQLNTRYYELKEHTRAMTIGGKFTYLAALMSKKPGNLLLFFMWGAAFVMAYRKRSEWWIPITRTSPQLLFSLFLCLLLPFLLIGAFAATPSQEQYFYPLAPILLWSLLHLLATLSPTQKWPHRLFALVIIVSCLLALPSYMTISHLFFPSQWEPIKIHREGKRLAKLRPSQKVLTLAPILPLEGGLPIYPALATGPFSLRVAPLLSPEERQKQGLLSATELLRVLEDDPSLAVLIGLNNNDRVEEESLRAYANEREYVKSNLQTRKGELLLAPLIDWGKQIRLGGYYSRLPEPLDPDRKHVLTFYLQALSPIEEDLNLLVRLVGQDGQELWRDEGWPFGSPTSTWSVGEVWPNAHVFDLPSTLLPNYYRLELGFYDPTTLEHLPAQQSQTGEPRGKIVTLDYLALGDLPAAPKDNISADLGTSIRFLGAEHPSLAQPNESLKIRLFWQAMAESESNYTTFVHLIAPDGQLVSQQDQPPLGGFFPTSAWEADDLIFDDYVLQLPPDAPAGRYELRVGMYDPETVQRLPVVMDGDAPTAGDSVLVGSIEVK